MNRFLIVTLIFTALCTSCYFTRETCPTTHKSSTLTIHKPTRMYENVMIYEHVVECCGMEKKIYGSHPEMIHEWIKVNPNMIIYHTFWGSLEWDSLTGMYVFHFFLCAFIFMLWAAIEKDCRRGRR